MHHPIYGELHNVSKHQIKGDGKTTPDLVNGMKWLFSHYFHV